MISFHASLPWGTRRIFSTSRYAGARPTRSGLVYATAEVTVLVPMDFTSAPSAPEALGWAVHWQHTSCAVHRLGGVTKNVARQQERRQVGETRSQLVVRRFTLISSSALAVVPGHDWRADTLELSVFFPH